MMTKNALAMLLSRLAVFEQPVARLEQYPTPSDIAADLLWEVRGELIDARVVDLGCGTGILGIGALLLGARHVCGYEVDGSLSSLVKRNLDWIDEQVGGELGSIGEKFSLVIADVTKIDSLEADVIIMNPPFGTRAVHADRLFLSKAIGVPVICSLHKTSTMDYLAGWMEKQGHRLAWKKAVSFPLKATMDHHTKTRQMTDVTLCVFTQV